MDIGYFGVIPVEVLEKIFSYLSWDDLTRCSQVSERVRFLALGVREKYAERHCEQDFGSDLCHEAKRKSQLSWSELHHSLSLWPRVTTARMDIKASEPLEEHYSTTWDEEIKMLQILKGGVIAYAHSIEYHEDGTYSIAPVNLWSPNSNAVIYYDSATLKEIRVHNSDFNFACYGENDHLMVFKVWKDDDHDDGRNAVLHVHSKETNKKYELQVNNSFSYYYKAKFFIVEKKLFYISNRRLYMAKEVTENGESGMNVSNLESCEYFKHIMSIVHVNEDQVYILADGGSIFSVIGSHVDFLRKVNIHNVDRSEAVNTLSAYGFNWSEHAIYKWIGAPEFRREKWVGLTHLKKATVFSYGKVVIIGTCHRTLHIYINPYKDGLLRLYNKRPTYNIDLRQYESCQVFEDQMPSHHRKILQIDVIEIKNGHRIVMLHCQTIVTIEFTHGR